MNWFEYLKQGGYFEPVNNPEPVQVRDGYEIPYWQSLSFLEKLAITFKEGRNLDLVPDVLEIIKSVSENPKDNYHTWYAFLKILLEIPNELIPASVFKYILVWVSGMFRTNLQTSIICEKMLPKFLEHPSKDDIEKAEAILGQLFTLIPNRIEKESEPGHSYRTPFYFYYFRKAFTEDSLQEKIIKYCSEKVIFQLFESINLLVRDFKVTTSWTHSSITYTVEYIPEKTIRTLLVKALQPGHTDPVELIRRTYSYDTNAKELLNELKVDLTAHQIPLPDEADLPFRQLEFGLSNDLFSIFGHYNITDLDDELKYSENETILFILIARLLLDEKAKQQRNKAKHFLSKLLTASEYQLPVFKRLVLFVIANHWQELNSLFWSLLGDEDSMGLLSQYYYRNETYYLLQKNQQFIVREQAEKLKNILSRGPQGDSELYPHKDAWQHRWLNALKENEYFREDYRRISSEQNMEGISSDDENDFQFLKADKSPYSKQEILNMPLTDLTQTLKNFRDKSDVFKEPSINGLSIEFKKAITEEPDHFLPYLDLFLEVPFIYIYEMLEGYRELHKKGHNLDWEPLLEFCNRYVNADGFAANKYVIENPPFSANNEWVSGVVGNLISDVLNNDNNKIEDVLLPLVKQILLRLVSILPVSQIPSQPDSDNVSRTLNSTSGKILSALLDYGLNHAKAVYDMGHWSPAWDMEIRDIFERVLIDEVPEVYTLIGMRLNAFYFIDSQWTIEHVTSFITLENSLWSSFLDGLVIGRVQRDELMYKILYPHLKRAILEVKGFENRFSGLVRQISIFYLLGFENLDNNDALNFLLWQNTPAKFLQQQVNYVGNQSDSLKNMETEDNDKIRMRVIDFWKFIDKKLYDPKTEENINLLGSLVQFTAFLKFIDSETFPLLKHAASIRGERGYLDELFEQLLRFSQLPDSYQQAEYIASILAVVEYKKLYMVNQELLKDLVEYLFQNDQQMTAELICNRVQKEGYEFLRELYNHYSTN